MIGKGKFFDLISRTADDINSTDLTIDEILNNYKEREEKFKTQIEKCSGV